MFGCEDVVGQDCKNVDDSEIIIFYKMKVCGIEKRKYMRDKVGRLGVSMYF